MEDIVETQTVQDAQLGDFDPRVVHYRDQKTGRLVDVKPFRVHVEEGERFYEYPKNSGNLWYENRLPAGRWEADDKGSRKIVRGADHKTWTPPPTEDELLKQSQFELESKNTALEKEVAALKAEAKKSQAKPAVQTKQMESKTQAKTEK